MTAPQTAPNVGDVLRVSSVDGQLEYTDQNTFTSPIEYDSGWLDQFISTSPSLDDTQHGDFNEVIHTAINVNADDTDNAVWSQGFNVSSTHGVQDSSLPMMRHAMETRWVPFGTTPNMEYHLAFTPVGGSERRFLSWIGQHDGGHSTISFKNEVYEFQFQDGTTLLRLDSSGAEIKSGGLYVRNNGAQMYQRNAADNAWLALPHFNSSGQLKLDTNSVLINNIATENVNFSRAIYFTGAADKRLMTTNGNLLLGTNSAEAMRITTSNIFEISNRVRCKAGIRDDTTLSTASRTATGEYWPVQFGGTTKYVAVYS